VPQAKCVQLKPRAAGGSVGAGCGGLSVTGATLSKSVIKPLAWAPPPAHLVIYSLRLAGSATARHKTTLYLYKTGS
jgi:hypothetical protein